MTGKNKPEIKLGDRSSQSAIRRNHHRASRAYVGGKICADGPDFIWPTGLQRSGEYASDETKPK